MWAVSPCDTLPGFGNITLSMVHAIQNVHEALKLVLHVAMLVLMPSQILNLYLR